MIDVMNDGLFSLSVELTSTLTLQLKRDFTTRNESDEIYYRMNVTIMNMHLLMTKYKLWRGPHRRRRIRSEPS